MWHAHPVGWLARTYAVEEGRHAVATLEFGTWSERGALAMGAERLEIVREGVWNPKFHLQRAGERVATGMKPGAFARGFTILHGGEEYRIDPTSWVARSHRLMRGRHDLGRIHVRGFLGRRIEIELADEVAPELRLFAFWLVLLGMRRASAAAAS